jgi:hypothetical protein
MEITVRNKLPSENISAGTLFLTVISKALDMTVRNKVRSENIHAGASFLTVIS